MWKSPHTRFSTQAGTPPGGTPVNMASKQTGKLSFCDSEPEHFEPEQKQASETTLS